MPARRVLPIPPLVIVLAVAAMAAPASAQETPPAPEAPAREPAAADRVGVESAREWEAFSRAFAARLRRQGRVPDAVEEYVAVAALSDDDVDVLADAAVLLIDHATGIAHGLEPMSPYVLTADNLVRMGVQRGGLGDPRLAYVIGRLRLIDGQWSVAYDMLAEARAKGFDPVRLRHWFFLASVNRAPALLDRGRATDVISELEGLIADQPDHPQALEAKVNLAAAYRRNNDRVLSQRILEELTVSHPQDHKPWSGLGREHLEQGRLEEALEAYRKALALSGRDGRAYAQNLASIALVLYKLGRIDESERAAKGYLELQADSAAGLHLLAMLQREKGDTREAVRLLRRADRLESNDPSVLTLLEQILYERGETEEARKVRARLEAIYHEPSKDVTPDAPRDGAGEQPPGGDGDG